MDSTALAWGLDELEAARETLLGWAKLLEAGHKRVVTWAVMTQWLDTVPQDVKDALPGFVHAVAKTADTDRLRGAAATELVEKLSKDVLHMIALVDPSVNAPVEPDGDLADVRADDESAELAGGPADTALDGATEPPDDIEDCD